MASRQILTDALRIKLVMDNPRRLKLSSWVSDEWTKHPMSFYYASEDDLDKAVFETIEEVLAAENKELTTASANKLRNTAKLSNKPPEVVNAMKTANDEAVNA